MKYSHLKINGSLIWGTNELTRDDLIRLKQRSYDCIIDVQEGKYFDVETNSWKEIEGE